MISRFELGESHCNLRVALERRELSVVVLIAPESVVISIKTLTDEDERFEIKFGSNGAGPEH